MDYRALLKKYMEHVVECEGVSFVSHISTSDGFTAEERAELERLDGEV